MTNSKLKSGSSVSDRIITLPPQCGRVVGIGSFDSEEAEPDFELTLSPKMDDEIGIAYQRLELSDEGRYMLCYQFQNFGQTSCQITLHRKP